MLPVLHFDEKTIIVTLTNFVYLLLFSHLWCSLQFFPKSSSKTLIPSYCMSRTFNTNILVQKYKNKITHT